MTWVKVNGKREQQCPLCGKLLAPSAAAYDLHLLEHYRARPQAFAAVCKAANAPEKPEPAGA